MGFGCFDFGDFFGAGGAFEGGAEVGGDDAFVGLDVAGGAFDEFLALDEAGDAVAEVEDEAHVVLDDEDGDALVPDGEDEFFGDAGFLGVHAGGGLVEEEESGVAGECAGDFQLALVSVGEVAREVVGLVLEADELQKFHGAFAAGVFCLVVAGEAQEGGPEAFLGPGVAADEDVLQDGHVGEESDVLEGAGDAGLGDEVGLGGQDGALVADLAFGGDVEAGEAVEEGGLAGAVGADETDDLAAVDGEVDVADGGESAESHGDAAGVEDGGGGRGGGFGGHVITPPPSWCRRLSG